MLKDLRVGQYDDFVLEADIWIEKPEGNFNTIITHHLKSHGTTCNQGSSWNVNVGYTLYIHSKGDIKFLMGTGQGTSRDVDLNGGKLKPKTWTKLKVTFLKGVATLYVDCAPKGSAKFVIGERQISATVPTKIGQYGCDNLKSVFKGKMRFVSIYKPTAPLYFRACFLSVLMRACLPACLPACMNACLCVFLRVWIGVCMDVCI